MSVVILRKITNMNRFIYLYKRKYAVSMSVFVCTNACYFNNDTKQKRLNENRTHTQTERNSKKKRTSSNGLKQ